MIRSSVFTFDESSVWDPKVIRQLLNIPEDQLNILRNLPEWSKHRANDNILRLEKDSICENSQSTKHISEEDLHKQNIKLFDKNSEIRRGILETYKLNATKLSRSISLYEIDKISKNSSCSSDIKTALSIPDLHLLTENLYSKNFSSEFRSKNSPPERYSSSLNKNINLPIFKESGVTCITVQTNTGTSEAAKREHKTSTENSNMEVDSQLPVAILSHVDKVRKSGTDVEMIVENNTVSSSHTLQPTGKLNISNVQPTHLTSTNKFDNSNLNVNLETSKLAKADGLNSCEKNGTNLCIVKGTIPSHNNNYNLGVSEKITKITESEDLKSCEKNEPDLNIVKETVHIDDNSNNENKRIEINVGCQEPTKTNETSDQCSESNNSKELFVSNMISSNDHENKICDSRKSNMDVENAQQAVHHDVKDNKSVFAETLSTKRKLESKSRSSKKRRSAREKQGYLEERSIKRAGEISYCTEQIKTMLDMLKQSS